MERSYPGWDDIGNLFGGEWETGVWMKKGERRTNWGVAFVCKVAHLSSAANEPISDATAIYARVFTGAYVATTTYKKYDGVSYNGAGFFSRIEDNLGHTPPADGTSDAYWYCYAQRGIMGPKGDAGIAATNQSVERPSGTMDGSNQTFTLAHTPAGNILLLYGGIALTEGVGYDFTVSGTTITLLGDIKPVLGENMLAVYLY